MTYRMLPDDLVEEINTIIDAIKPSLKTKSLKNISKAIDKTHAGDHAKSLAHDVAKCAFDGAGIDGKVYPHVVAGQLEMLCLKIRMGLVD